jgi:hypothetical protein
MQGRGFLACTLLSDLRKDSLTAEENLGEYLWGKTVLFYCSLL